MDGGLFNYVNDTIMNDNFIHVGVDSEFSNSRKDGCAVIQIAVNNIVFCIDTFKISEKVLFERNTVFKIFI